MPAHLRTRGWGGGGGFKVPPPPPLPQPGGRVPWAIAHAGQIPARLLAGKQLASRQPARQPVAGCVRMRECLHVAFTAIQVCAAGQVVPPGGGAAAAARTTADSRWQWQQQRRWPGGDRGGGCGGGSGSRGGGCGGSGSGGGHSGGGGGGVFTRSCSAARLPCSGSTGRGAGVTCLLDGAVRSINSTASCAAGASESGAQLALPALEAAETASEG